MHQHKPEVWAAVLTHRLASGEIDEAAVMQNASFLAAAGVKGLVVNGGTGEYAGTVTEEFSRMVAIYSKATRGRCDLLAGIGSCSVETSVQLGLAAFEAGVQGVLLPPPHFFRYSQEDIACWCSEIAARLPGPILLYGLPQFTNSLEVQTVRTLLGECPNITGIKDSSGSLEMLRALTVDAPEARRIVGNDIVLVQARREQICDEVISGVAGVLPELILYLGTGDPMEDPSRYRTAARWLDEYIEQIQRFPVPWGLKLTAEYRGLATAAFAQPLSPARRQQSQAFLKWLDGWWERAEITLPLSARAC